MWASEPVETRAEVSGGAATDDVYVIVDATDDAPVSGRQPRPAPPIASILFVAGRPTSHIRANAGVVRGLIDGARIDGESLIEGPRVFRNRVIGRVLGRAVAHELGHYLLASSGHTPRGLMRVARADASPNAPVAEPLSMDHASDDSAIATVAGRAIP
jgi:hypothetical protein